jgi:hypothetical protein
MHKRFYVNDEMLCETGSFLVSLKKYEIFNLVNAKLMYVVWAVMKLKFG